MSVDTSTVFVDSNVWLYALIVGQDSRKESTAQSIIQTSSIVISTQVINEVCVNAIKSKSLKKKKFVNSFAHFSASIQLLKLIRGRY